ncbi:MAG: BLUF domain-containing protein [Comamonadaceae bacterium]|nr:BLUF domain-containing protein [Comamonadaceae bacterium]
MHSRLPPLEAQPGEEEVERVICASLAWDRNGVYATMEDIREHALRHNPAVGIHVALLYQSGWFLHWAEGPKQAVRTLFDRIRQDPRHHDQTVVHHSRGRRLLMTTWSMLLSPSSETPEQFGRRVLALREQMKRGRQYAPTSVVRQLMMPMRLPQAQSLPDPEAYHRVVVCAAYGNGAFGLVHWLAQQHSLPKKAAALRGVRPGQWQRLCGVHDGRAPLPRDCGGALQSGVRSASLAGARLAFSRTAVQRRHEAQRGTARPGAAGLPGHPPCPRTDRDGPRCHHPRAGRAVRAPARPAFPRWRAGARQRQRSHLEVHRRPSGTSGRAPAHRLGHREFVHTPVTGWPALHCAP